MPQQYDVAGLGNAIVDVIASVDDRFLLNHRIAKGGMTLIDEFRAKELLKVLADNQQTMSSLHEVAGGSAANTLAGLASLGGNGVSVGKVFDVHVGAGHHLHHPPHARRFHHRQLPDRGDPGRPAQHEHLSGRLPRTDAR
jgi:hypothetical protein